MLKNDEHKINVLFFSLMQVPHNWASLHVMGTLLCQ